MGEKSEKQNIADETNYIVLISPQGKGLFFSLCYSVSKMIQTYFPSEQPVESRGLHNHESVYTIGLKAFFCIEFVKLKQSKRHE